MSGLLNGFNNGIDTTDGVGGNEPIRFTIPNDYYEDDDYDDDYDDWEERRQEELHERACNCTCGAWQNIKGQTIHVADCCCGAE